MRNRVGTVNSSAIFPLSGVGRPLKIPLRLRHKRGGPLASLRSRVRESTSWEVSFVRGFPRSTEPSLWRWKALQAG
jgi:hypothetical protein